MAIIYKSYPPVIIVITLSTFALSHSYRPTHQVCEDVRSTDEVICQKIEKPTTSNREKVISDIEHYVKALEALYEVLKTKRDWIIDICKDVFTLGTARFMNIRFDQEYLMRGFNWTNKEMNKYLDLRDDVLDEWIRMEPYIAHLSASGSKHKF